MSKRIISLIICLMMVMGSIVFVHAEGLDAPTNITVEIKTHTDGYPYFSLKLEETNAVKELAYSSDGETKKLTYGVEMKVGNGDWEEMGGAGYLPGDEITVSPYDGGFDGDIDIKANTYYFRAYFYYVTWEVYDEFGNSRVTSSMQSPYSKVASIGIDAYQYKGASTWAVLELDRAAEYGFITDKIKDQMNGPITREELCEVIMKLYEKMVGEATYTDMSAFTDTTNPEIFKAFELGIVNGVGNNKFAPAKLTNRQEVATMMYRAVKKVKPDADMSITGAPVFNDERLIAAWASTPIKFMSKNEFLRGSNGSVNPLGTTTREQAVLIIVRVYEKYVN